MQIGESFKKILFSLMQVLKTYSLQIYFFSFKWMLVNKERVESVDLQAIKNDEIPTKENVEKITWQQFRNVTFKICYRAH